jgi:hypothetical protein
MLPDAVKQLKTDVKAVPITRAKQKTYLEADILLGKEEELLADTKIHTVIGLLIDAEKIRRAAPAELVTRRMRSIRAICSEIAAQKDAFYRKMGFHMWVVEADDDDEEEDEFLVDLINQWRAAAQAELGLQGDGKISLQRLPHYAALTGAVRGALETAVDYVVVK